MTTSAPRFHEVDLLRGLACVSVVAYHFLSTGPRSGAMSGGVHAIDAVARYGYLGVHLFFIISGFVILMSAQGATPRAFVASRAARLYPALWAGATLSALTAWAFQHPKYGVSVGEYLVNLTMAPHWFGVDYIDGAYWSLAVELHFYILVFAAIRFGVLKHVHLMLAAWLAISAVNALRPSWPLEFGFDARWAPLFVAGGLFYLIRTSGVSAMRLALLAASFGLAQFYAVQEAARLSARTNGAQLSPVVVVVAISVFFAVFALIALRKLAIGPHRTVFYAGMLTYPIYVVHQNVGYMLYNRLDPLLGNWWLSLAIVVCIVGIAGWTIARFVEKPVGPRLRKQLNAAPLRLPRAQRAQ